MFRIKVTVHILLKKRRAVNNNTLRDAQKRQKTPLIVVKSSLFIASRRSTRDFRANFSFCHHPMMPNAILFLLNCIRQSGYNEFREPGAVRPEWPARAIR